MKKKRWEADPFDVVENESEKRSEKRPVKVFENNVWDQHGYNNLTIESD
jgi:hypothetical protein